jgi:hypothetical protein
MPSRGSPSGMDEGERLGPHAVPGGDRRYFPGVNFVSVRTPSILTIPISGANQ